MRGTNGAHPGQPSTTHERLIALIESAEDHLAEAAYNVKRGLWASAACDLAFARLDAGEARTELACLQDAGDPNLFLIGTTAEALRRRARSGS